MVAEIAEVVVFDGRVDILACALGFMSTPLVSSLLVRYAYWASISIVAHVEGDSL